MARERIYRSNAERQAAYRARHWRQQEVPQGRLASLAQERHGRLRQAIEEGKKRVPAMVLGECDLPKFWPGVSRYSGRCLIARLRTAHGVTSSCGGTCPGRCCR
jgi:hypothetical protein